jgi:hypothetical protein
MTHALLVCALLHHAPPPAAKTKSKPKTLQVRANQQALPENGAQSLSHTIVGQARPSVDLQGALERAMGSARLGLSSGKLVLMRSSGEQVALAVRGAKVTPLFDASANSVTAHLRISF